MGLKNVLTPKIFWSTKFGTLKLCNKNILFDIFTPKNYGRKIFSAPEFLDTKKLLCLKIYTFKGDSPSISRLVHQLITHSIKSLSNQKNLTSISGQKAPNFSQLK